MRLLPRICVLPDGAREIKCCGVLFQAFTFSAKLSRIHFNNCIPRRHQKLRVHSQVDASLLWLYQLISQNAFPVRDAPECIRRGQYLGCGTNRNL